ncbi:probable pleckstriny domain-containing family N member 1 [Grus japonensis]|uniref:Probable pleckstriny domain-containing family N member 1 n=1 Tax=Grus japonensis TaxID=30415 RepID=A0ABC9XMA2_GRUJA
MGCCSLSARKAGSAGTGQDEVELLKTDRTRMWSNSEGHSEASLHSKDLAILAETGDVSISRVTQAKDSEERLLILFPEDLLFLSVDKDRTAITYKGKLPLAGIQAKEKSAMLGRLQFEITVERGYVYLACKFLAELGYSRAENMLQPEKILDTLTLQPPPIIPQKSWKRQ